MNPLASFMRRLLPPSAVASSSVPEVSFDQSRGTARATLQLDLAAALAAVAITAGLGVAANVLHGEQNPDWLGYEAMYLEEGAHLAALGRDPAFIWIVQGARELFGSQGYETFRLCLLAYFLTVAAILAFRIPAAPRIRLASGLGVGVVLFAIVFSKFTVQIREGLAFSFALPAVSSIIRPSGGERTRSAFVPPALLALAILVHGGMVFLGLAYALGLLLAIALGERVRGVAVGRFLMVVGIAFAVLVGAYLGRSIELTVEMLGELGVGVETEAFSSAAKLLYWILYGVLVFSLRRQAMDTVPALADRRGTAFCVVYVSLVLPFTYALALYMVVTSQLPFTTSMVSRLLSTAVGLTMFLVLLRGRANALTVVAALLVIGDQARTIYAATLPG